MLAWKADNRIPSARLESAIANILGLTQLRQTGSEPDFCDAEGRTYEQKAIHADYPTFFAEIAESTDGKRTWRPAGVATSKADFFILVRTFRGDALIIPAAKMLALLAEPWRKADTRPGVRGNAPTRFAQGALIPWSALEDVALRCVDLKDAGLDAAAAAFVQEVAL